MMQTLALWPLIAGLLCTVVVWNRYSHWKRVKKIADLFSYAIGGIALVLSVSAVNGYIAQANQMIEFSSLEGHHVDFYFDAIADLNLLCRDATDASLNKDCPELTKIYDSLYANNTSDTGKIPLPPNVPVTTPQSRQYLSKLASQARTYNQERERVLKQQAYLNADIFNKIQLMGFAVPLLAFAFGIGLARKIWDAASKLD